MSSTAGAVTMTLPMGEGDADPLTKLQESSPMTALHRVPPHDDPRTDSQLWPGIVDREVATLAEVYRRHGGVAFAVAVMITQDPELAEQAVTAAFIGLASTSDRHSRRSVRAELLDAVRRSAAGPSTVGSPSLPGHALDGLDRSMREVLSLAIAGRCGADEIAAIMRIDRATAQRDLRSGLQRIETSLRRARPAAWSTAAVSPVGATS